MSDTLPPETIAVVGLGLLGRSIAACFLGRGFHVIGVDYTPEQHTRARDAIAAMIDELIVHAICAAEVRDEWPARYTSVADYASIRGCSFVVESVTEDLAAKEQALDAIESVVAPEVVIASNTSAIPISQLQQRRKQPARFVGMHWAEPAHATRFMELIRGAQTSPAALQTAAELAQRLGKEPSLCQLDLPGFIVNRIGYAMYREALHLLELGMADAATIDRSLRNAFGLWATVCGPFRWIDITGGPELYARAMKDVLPTLSKASELPPTLQKLADDGARGIVNGRGFFPYTEDEARAWEELYRKHAWRVAQMQDEYFPMKNA